MKRENAVEVGKARQTPTRFKLVFWLIVRLNSSCLVAGSPWRISGLFISGSKNGEETLIFGLGKGTGHHSFSRFPCVAVR